MHTLTVNNSGGGTVSSDPTGIDCGSGCSYDFAANTSVTLTASPDSGWKFTGWSGDGCSGTGQCVLSMDSDLSVTAGFAQMSQAASLTIQFEGSGQGRVTSTPAGIDCTTGCSGDFELNDTIILTGTPQSGYALDGWRIDSPAGSTCPGNGDCLILLDQAYTVTSIFNPDTDLDGVSDAIENAGPNSGDGNDDGTPDADQSQVASFPDTNGHYVTMVTDAGILEDLRSTGYPTTTDLPRNRNFPSGFLGFRITGLTAGQSVTVTLLLHQKDEPLDTYLRYGPTWDSAVSTWYEFLKGDGDLGATITQEETVTRIVLYFKDGMKGDDDLSANGTIVDFGGPGNTTSSQGGGSGGGGCFLKTMME